MVKRRFAIDFDALKPDALAWVLASEKRKVSYHRFSDEFITKVFESRYEHIEEEADDVLPDRIIVNDDDAAKVRDRWFGKMKTRMTAHEGRNEASLDPMTLWLIGQVIAFLIQWWLDNRRKRIRKELGS